MQLPETGGRNTHLGGQSVMWKNPGTYVLILLAVVVGGWFTWALTKQPTPRYLTVESVRKIKAGMTREEVVSHLGIPDRSDHEDSSSGSLVHDVVEAMAEGGEPYWSKSVLTWQGLVRNGDGDATEAGVVITLEQRPH